MSSWKNRFWAIGRSGWFLAGVGLILGALIILAIRFINYQPEEEVHYHANFAVYVNGQQEKFTSPSYYEETSESACSLQEHVESPLERAHMHGNVSDVVHVEDHLVTWGHFFQNLGWAVDSLHLKTRDQVLPTDQVNKMAFVLNGKQVDEINSMVVGGEDRLLVDFGSSDQTDLDKRFQSIASTAGKYNTTPDPASCGSGHDEPTFSDRLKNLF